MCAPSEKSNACCVPIVNINVNIKFPTADKVYGFTVQVFCIKHLLIAFRRALVIVLPCTVHHKGSHNMRKTNSYITHEICD